MNKRNECLPTTIPNLLNRVEFAELIGITPRSADRWAWNRKGPPRFKIGTQVYYDRADVEAYIEELRQKAKKNWSPK